MSWNGFGSHCGLRYYTSICLELAKTTKTSIKITCILADIKAEHLLKTILKYYL
jgi:hypothetical protein